MTALWARHVPARHRVELCAATAWLPVVVIGPEDNRRRRARFQQAGSLKALQPVTMAPASSPSGSRQPSQRELYVGGCRAFFLIAVFLVGHAIYKYYQYAEFEVQKGAIKLMADLRIYVNLYEWGGKNAVVGFILIAAGICFVASLLMWRKLRTLPPAEAEGS